MMKILKWWNDKKEATWEEKPPRQRGSRCKGCVVAKPSFLWSINKGWPLQGECSKWGGGKSWGWRGRSLQAIVKDADVRLGTRESHRGVSIMNYLMCSLFFILTLLYSKPLLLISHSLCTGKTPHATIALGSLPLPQPKHYHFSSLGVFLGNVPLYLCWENLFIRKWFCFFFFSGTYLLLENDIGCTNLIIF